MRSGFFFFFFFRESRGNEQTSASADCLILRSSCWSWVRDYDVPRVSGLTGQREDSKDPPSLLSSLTSLNLLVWRCEGTSIVMSSSELDSPPPSPPSASSSTDDEETDNVPCGYDFQFIDDLRDEHKCPVCLHAIKNAVQTKCGHRFCEDCLLHTFRYCNLFHFASLLFGYQSWPVVWTQSRLIQVDSVYSRYK